MTPILAHKFQVCPVIRTASIVRSYYMYGMGYMTALSINLKMTSRVDAACTLIMSSNVSSYEDINLASSRVVAAVIQAFKSGGE